MDTIPLTCERPRPGGGQRVREARIPLILFVACVLLALSCHACAPGHPSHPMTEDDYEVYAAVVRHFAASHPAEGSLRVAVLDSTRTDAWIMPPIQDSAPPLWARTYGQTGALPEAVRDFQRIRGDDRPLTGSLPADFNLTMRTPRELDRGPINLDGVPPGVFIFSRVGFSHDRQHAFLFVMNHVGLNGASGRYYFLSKTAGVWHVECTPGGIFAS